MAAFPELETPEWLEGSLRPLYYKQHGGSGYNLTRAEVLDLYLDEIDAHTEWLNDTRGAEAKAIKQAAKAKK